MSDRFPKTQLAGLSQVPAICMGMHVRRASRILTQVYDAALRPVGLVLNQFTLLVSIQLVESTPITRLAQELFTDQTTLTRNLKLLEKRGLVAIAPGEDRRVKLVSLTPEGRDILAQALPLWEQAQSQVVQHFVGVASQNENRQQWQTLLSLLSAVKTLS
jgi:DNA-binding MarR family transcriptional regulator